MEKFQYKGFNPTEELRTRAERVLHRLMDKAPGDAGATAVLEFDGDRFRCSLEIGSASCPVAVETSHRFATIALEKAEIAVRRRLDRWRGTRFLDEELAPSRAPFRIAN